jgi:hypothetical protein
VRVGLLGTAPASQAVGPDFLYQQSPLLFGTRDGRGPLRIVLDTNILIDYFEHGYAMWAGDSLTEARDDEYGEHLEALQLILAVWVLRDIELVMLKESLRDSKRRKLDPARDQRNRNGWAEFYRALTHSPHHAADDVVESDVLSQRMLDRAVETVPSGGDQRLVRSALRDGAHVYLTRDKGVLRAASALRAFGLSAMHPGDLLGALSMYGALDFLWDPQSLSWPLPDQEKVAHLIWALPKPD